MLVDQIHTDLKTAMLAHQEVAVSTLRMLLSELKNAQIQKGDELEESEVVTVVQKELKRRKEAAESFRSGEREESALKEEAEAAILSGYLPTQMSDEELTKLVEEAINKVGATSMTQMGQVMGLVRGQVGQAAEPSRISALVKEKLTA